MLWGKFSKNLVFLSKRCFSRISIDPTFFSINRNFVLKFMGASAWFDWLNLFFNQSKIVFQVFLKQFFDYFKNIFFKKISTFLFSLTWQGFSTIFLSFSSKIFARFSSLKAGMTILSLLFVLFSWFLAFKGYFRTSLFLGFFMIQALFSEIDQWVLLGYGYIHDWYLLIWSICGFVKNWKF